MDKVKLIEKFNLAKTIILTVSSMRLFGCLLYKFDINIIESNDFTALVFYNNATKKLTINFSLFIINTMTVSELVYVIIHEILHVLNNHLSRGSLYLEKEIFNIAADHVINKSIDEDISNKILSNGVSSPDGRIIIKSLIDKNLSTEEVYNYLLQHSKKETSTYYINMNDDSDSGSESDSDKPSENSKESNDDELKSDENKSSTYVKITKTIITMDDGQIIEFTSDIETNDQNEGKGKETEIRNDARRLLNTPLLKDRGGNTGSINSLINEALKVEIPWTELLENTIKKHITEISDNKTWRRINKRMFNYNLILPYNELDCEKNEKLYIIADTSGSISEEELKKFISIIKDSMIHFKTIVKIDHDETIKSIDEYETENFIVDQFNFMGGGGTSHKEVYEYFEQLFNEGEEVELILFLTDFYSDIESIHHNYKWIHEFPYKYLVTSKKDVNNDIDVPIYIK